MAIYPFIEELFPESISYGSSGGPGFKTEIFMSAAGFEQRNMLFSKARAKYDVAHSIKDKTDMDTILKFFYTMRGRATGFRFKDWSDYTLKNEQIGIGDGTKIVFGITKTYSIGPQKYVRDILKIKQGAVTNVRVNGAGIPNTGYTVDHNNGTITFTSPPANGHAVIIDCTEFHVPVRFDVDEMPMVLEAFEVESWDGITLVELKMERT